MSRDSTNRYDYSKSGGQSELFDLVRAYFPDHIIIKQDINMRKFCKRLGYDWKELEIEYGRPLSGVIVDVFVGNPPLAIEFHGRQHFEFVRHFHGDLKGFTEHKERDNQKFWLCSRLGFPLVVFRYDDKLSMDMVIDRINEAKANFELIEDITKCPTCKLYVKTAAITDGKCHLCDRPKPSFQKMTDEQKTEQAARNKEAREAAKERLANDPEHQRRKQDANERAKQARKEAKERMESNPVYQQKQAEAKERAREARKEAANRAKEWREKHKRS